MMYILKADLNDLLGTPGKILIFSGKAIKMISFMSIFKYGLDLIKCMLS